MRRILGAIMCLVLLAGAAAPIWAQGSRRHGANRAAQQQRRYDNSRRVYYDRDYRDGDRSIWERSRDKITVAGGAGAGAVIGGLAGGKKGAIIGAIIGAGGAGLYTYKVRDRDQDRYRR